MKCWNSAFNAQGSRVIIVVVQVGGVKISVAAVQALRKKENTRWNSVYHQNWWKKLVIGSQLFPFCKIFNPSYTFDALLLCGSWPFSPPNRLTLRISLLGSKISHWLSHQCCIEFAQSFLSCWVAHNFIFL